MANPVAVIRHVQDGDDRYDAILLWCPGCEYERKDHVVAGLHMLPVSGDRAKRPVWNWNNYLVSVSLEPSILIRNKRGPEQADFVCHSFLRNGQWQFLGDCTHALANQIVPMVPLPDWVLL